MSEHHLNDSWSMYYAPRGKRSKYDTKNYGGNLTEIGKFNSLQSFYQHYCYLKRPSAIPIDSKIMMFRSGYKPMWESWPRGGTWILMFKKRELEELNKTWETLLLSMIGEQFESHKVVGVVLSKRSKKNLLELWISDRSEETKLAIGEKLREALNLSSENLTFYFKEHFKSMQEKSTLKSRESYTFVKTPFETPIFTPVHPANTADNFELDAEDFKLCS